MGGDHLLEDFKIRASLGVSKVLSRCLLLYGLRSFAGMLESRPFWFGERKNAKYAWLSEMFSG